MKLLEIIEGVIVLIVEIVIANAVAAAIPIPFLKTPVAILLFLGLFFSFVRFTTVEEGTGKLIMRLGGVVKVFIQWTGYKLDERGNVVPVGYKLDRNYNLVPTGEKIPEKPKRPWYGGLRVWIGTPFDKVYKYNLRYHSVEEIEGKRIPVYHEKKEKDKADSVMLRPDRYWRKTIQLETGDGQFPDVEWQIGMRCENPEKTIFKSPHNWVENALNELEPSLRSFTRTKNLKPFLDLTRIQIWDVMKDDHAVTLLRKEWGVKIDENEISIFDVTPPKAYQEALAAKSKAEMEAEAAKRRMEIEAKARAAETVGTVIEMMAKARGKKVEEIQAEIETKPRLRKEFLKLANDLIVRKIGIEGAAYVDIRVEGAPEVKGKTEGQGFFDRLIDKFAEAMIKIEAAKQRMPKGKRPREEKERRPRSKVEEIKERIRKKKGWS